jgi:hypothetical protein
MLYDTIKSAVVPSSEYVVLVILFTSDNDKAGGTYGYKILFSISTIGTELNVLPCVRPPTDTGRGTGTPPLNVGELNSIGDPLIKTGLP